MRHSANTRIAVSKAGQASRAGFAAAVYISDVDTTVAFGGDDPAGRTARIVPIDMPARLVFEHAAGRSHRLVVNGDSFLGAILDCLDAAAAGVIFDAAVKILVIMAGAVFTAGLCVAGFVAALARNRGARSRIWRTEARRVRTVKAFKALVLRIAGAGRRIDTRAEAASWRRLAIAIAAGAILALVLSGQTAGTLAFRFVLTAAGNAAGRTATYLAGAAGRIRTG